MPRCRDSKTKCPGPQPGKRLATPLERLLGNEYDSFLREWAQRESESEIRTFRSVPVYLKWRTEHETKD